MTEADWNALQPGVRLRIMAGHPWAGHAGMVLALEQWRGRGMVYPKVKIDAGPGVPAGLSCFVVHPGQAEVELSTQRA